MSFPRVLRRPIALAATVAAITAPALRPVPPTGSNVSTTVSAMGSMTLSDVQVAMPAVGMTSVASLPKVLADRWDPAVAYYPPTAKVVVFGGSPQAYLGTWMNDTWYFDGTSWVQGPAAPAGLTPRGGAAI